MLSNESNRGLGKLGTTEPNPLPQESIEYGIQSSSEEDSLGSIVAVRRSAEPEPPNGADAAGTTERRGRAGSAGFV